MSRRTGVLAGALLALAPFLAAQDPQGQSDAHFPADIIPTQELIAWSWMQKPQPAPQPLPPPDKSVPQPEPRQGQSTDPQSTEQNATQTFTGKIVQDGDRYILKVSSSTAYQLAEAGNLKQFLNKDVKVVGTLDAGGHTIRVAKIDLLS